MPPGGRAGSARASVLTAVALALRSAELGEDSEARFPDRQLVELGVEAAELVAPALVAPLDLDTAHRQRRRGCPHGAEAAHPRLRRAQQVEVDLDREDLHQAAHVGVPELLVGVAERTPALDACARVHDLVAVDLAAAAFDLVLRAERKLGRLNGRLLACLHDRIVGAGGHAPQDLTTHELLARRRATFSTSTCVNAW